MNILIVEDDPIISQNIKESLESESYLATIASDGLTGEKLLKEGDYDCVILDINLPNKNGYEICKEFRRTNSTTPVILLTAFDELEDKVQGYDAGADDYLTKPFYMKELLLRIQSLIKRSKNSDLNALNEIIEFGDLIINQNTKSVSRKKVEINLTPREYQILIKLAAAKGNLVSKQDLLKEIWGSSLEFNTNNIEVYINFLRNKLDKPFETPLIKTKIGYGYYLDVKNQIQNE